MGYEYLLVEKQDGVATLTLNRPEKHNALSQGLLTELRTTLDAIDADKTIRVVVLTGAGRQAFSTGFDLNDASQIEEKKKLMGTLMEKGFKAFLELRDGPFRNNQ